MLSFYTDFSYCLCFFPILCCPASVSFIGDTPSNKTQALTKRAHLDIWPIDTLNQL